MRLNRLDSRMMFPRVVSNESPLCVKFSVIWILITLFTVTQLCFLMESIVCAGQGHTSFHNQSDFLSGPSPLLLQAVGINLFLAIRVGYSPDV